MIPTREAVWLQKQLCSASVFILDAAESDHPGSQSMSSA